MNRRKTKKFEKKYGEWPGFHISASRWLRQDHRQIEQRARQSGHEVFRVYGYPVQLRSRPMKEGE